MVAIRTNVNRMAVFCFLVSLPWSSLVAQEDVVKKSLIETQVPLCGELQAALDTIDFELQRQSLEKLLRVTQERMSEPSIFSVPELDLMIADLAKYDSFSPDQKKLAYDQQLKCVMGQFYIEKGKTAEAIEYRRQATELATRLYGENSLTTIDAEIRYAGSLSKTETETFESVTRMRSVLSRLENLKLQGANQYREALQLLMFVHLNRKEYKEAAVAGASFIKACETARVTELLSYLDGLGDMAAILNFDQRYAEAREYARKGLNRDESVTVETVTCTIKLLQQYALANVGLQDYAKASQAYKSTLELMDRFPYFSDRQRVTILKEYLEPLRKSGDTQQTQEIERQLAELEQKNRPRMSRFSDPE